MCQPKYGNRQLNSAVHHIAVTQLGLDGPGRVSYHKRLATGDTGPMALRQPTSNVVDDVNGVPIDHL